MIESPVIDGEFRTGCEPMLWRPGLDHARLRRRMVLASLWPTPARYAACSIGLIGMGIGTAPVGIGWLMVGVGVLAAGCAVLCACVTYHWFARDHQHKPGTACFLERMPGKYFYRPSDFVDLSTPITRAVGRIIAAVREVHASSAVAWLDPEHLRHIHRVAWNALHLVDQTRALHGLVGDPRRDALPHELAQAQAQLAAVDEAVDHVLTCLHQAVILVRAWEGKLAELDLRTRLRTELESMPHEVLTATIRGAESVPESLFAYLTAARDVTNAGPFTWERA